MTINSSTVVFVRTTIRGYRCAQPRQLAVREKLSKSPILSHTRGSRCGSSHSYSQKMTSPTMVSEISWIVDYFAEIRNGKTMPWDIWCSCLTRLRLSPSAIDRFEPSWARRTLRSHNNVLLQLIDCCYVNDNFFPMKSTGLWLFFCVSYQLSLNVPSQYCAQHPPHLATFTSLNAWKILYQIKSLQRLITALIKSNTECPLTKSKIMPF